MKAVIMAGGFGTRLRPLTANVPKPMAPMLNRPMMHHIVERLREAGITEMVSLLYYQPEAIESYFGDGSAFGVSMSYIRAESEFGTAAAVGLAREFLGDERFIVISADVLTDIDLLDAVRFHDEKKAQATLVLTRVTNPLAFGVVITDEAGRITRFLEKPSWGEVFSDTINTGIYVLEPGVLELIPPETNVDFSKDLFPRILRDGLGLYGHIAPGYWRDVGNLDEYQQAHRDGLSGAVHVSVDGETTDGVSVGDGTTVPDSLVTEGRVVLGKQVKLGEGVTLCNTVLGDGVTVGDGAKLSGVVVWAGSKLGAGAQVTDAVLCQEVEIGERATVEERVFVGDGCRIGAGAVIRSGVKLWPGKTVDAGATLATSLVWGDTWRRELFTNSRITGLSNIEMTPEFAAKLGAAFGSLLGPGAAVAVSRDPDNMSRVVHRAVMCGLMSAGVAAHDLRTVPIPVLRHTLRGSKEIAGIHTRKNPGDPRLTDMIFFDADGTDLSAARTKALERTFAGEDFKRAAYDKIASISFSDRAAESYRDEFLAALDTDAIRRAKLKVALDYANGVSSTLFPAILGELNASVIGLNAYLDPRALFRTPEQFTAAAAELGRVVTSLGLDAGFMINPGGERIHVVTADGRLVTDSELLSWVTWLVLNVEPDIQKLAVPVTASNRIDGLARASGVEVVRTADSHLALMRTVTTDRTVGFAGGSRGGFIFPRFLFAVDGMFSVAKLLELLARSGRSLAEVAAAVDQAVPATATVRHEVQTPRDRKGTIMRQLMAHAESHPHELVDGVKLTLGGADEGVERSTTVLILPESERDTFTVLAEGPDHAHVHKLAERYVGHVSDWRDSGSGK